MSTKKEKKEISFTINFIELVNKGLHMPTNQEGKLPEYTFQVSLDIRVNEEDKQSLHTLHVSVNEKDNGNTLGNVSVACAFNILNFEELVKVENGMQKLPKEYLDVLNTITIGTTRGVMYSEFRGTFLHEATLPVLDVKSFASSE